VIASQAGAPRRAGLATLFTINAIGPLGLVLLNHRDQKTLPFFGQ